MKQALLFDENRNPILVDADEVKAGLYSRNSEFVDPEYEFRVRFVCGAKNNGGPYFRLYYSYEDYQRLFPDKADRYQIVANMRRFDESKWHKHWKNKFAPFCSVEKYINDPLKKKWKYADAYFEELKTCIEFQHSYTALDYEERNRFYSALGITTIWLFDLTNANTRHSNDGTIDILEDNSKGFFRIAGIPSNLSDQKVYIQVRSGKIYRIKELLRRKSSSDLNSTIRFFHPTEIYTEDEFSEAIKANRIPNDPLRVSTPATKAEKIVDSYGMPWDWCDPPFTGITSIIDFFIHHRAFQVAVFEKKTDKKQVQVYNKDVLSHAVYGYLLEYKARRRVQIYNAEESIWKCLRCAYKRLE